MKWIIKMRGLDAEAVPVSVAGEQFRGSSGVDLVWVNLENLPGVGPKILMAVQVDKLFESELEALEYASDMLRKNAVALFERAQLIEQQAADLAAQARWAVGEVEDARERADNAARAVEELRQQSVR